MRIPLVIIIAQMKKYDANKIIIPTTTIAVSDCFCFPSILFSASLGTIKQLLFPHAQSIKFQWLVLETFQQFWNPWNLYKRASFTFTCATTTCRKADIRDWFNFWHTANRVFDAAQAELKNDHWCTHVFFAPFDLYYQPFPKAIFFISWTGSVGNRS